MLTDNTADACDTPGQAGANAAASGGAAIDSDAAIGAGANGQPDLDAIRAQVASCLADLQEAAQLTAGDVLIVGASSSEVVGQRIGTATSLAIGQAIVGAVQQFCGKVGCEAVYQCCEHLNRALVASADLAQRHGWRQVTAIPVPGAGGAVAASAFQTLPQACLVEQLEADAGIDIGDTLIGMHLRRVAVPVRGSLRQIGAAHVIMARTRWPLIGGTRAVYTQAEAESRLSLPPGKS